MDPARREDGPRSMRSRRVSFCRFGPPLVKVNRAVAFSRYLERSICFYKGPIMIREVEGDILLSKAELIAHGISPQDPFDSGLALALRERWPSLVRDYRHAMRGKAIEPGDIWAWTGVGDEGGTRRIVNLVTQETLGQGPSAKPGKATLENVGHALRKLAKFIGDEGIKSLALPRLATGVGKLEWENVKPLVARHLGDLDIPIFVYAVYRAGKQADEGLG
jgi:O-acetyl-ADP-ribose deacetylase (regulator of RNase III)